MYGNLINSVMEKFMTKFIYLLFLWWKCQKTCDCTDILYRHCSLVLIVHLYRFLNGALWIIFYLCRFIILRRLVE